MGVTDRINGQAHQQPMFHGAGTFSLRFAPAVIDLMYSTSFGS